MAASLALLHARAHAPHQKLPEFLVPGAPVAPVAVAFARPSGPGLGNNSASPPARLNSRGSYRASVRQMTGQRLVASFWGEHSENLNGSSVIGCGRWKAFNRKLVAEIKVEAGRAQMEGHFRCKCSWTCETCARSNVASIRSWLRGALFPALKENGLTGSLVTLTLSHAYDVPWEVPVASLKKAFNLMDRRLAKVYRKAGSVGKFKALEVTVGRNGLHPHYHILLTHRPDADIEALKDAMRKAWFAAVEEVGAFCNERGFDFQEDRLETYVAKMESAYELAAQSTKQGRKSGRTLSQLLDGAGAGDDTAGAEWQRAIAALGKTNRFHAGSLGKKLGIPTPTDWEDEPDQPAEEAADDAEMQEIPEPVIIEYPLDDHLAATNPASGRAGLALILRAARRGGKPAVLLMVNALREDNRQRVYQEQHESCNHARPWAYNDS